MLYNTVFFTPRLLPLCLVSLSPDFSGVRSYLLRIRNSLTSLSVEWAHTRMPLLWANVAHFFSLIALFALLFATLFFGSACLVQWQGELMRTPDPLRRHEIPQPRNYCEFANPRAVSQFKL